MVYEEIVEVSKIYSVAGKLSKAHPLLLNDHFVAYIIQRLQFLLLEEVEIQSQERYHLHISEFSFLMKCLSFHKLSLKLSVNLWKMELSVLTVFRVVVFIQQDLCLFER